MSSITLTNMHSITYLVGGTSSAYINMARPVKFLVEIENFTNQPLHWVNSEMKSGGFKSPPVNVIMAGHKGSFSGHKMSFALGASGAVTYRIGDSAKVINISFFCPLFTWSGGNILALKFFQWDQSQIEKMPRNCMYDQMNIEGPWKKVCNDLDSSTIIELNDEGGEYKMRGGIIQCFPATEIKVSLLPTDKNKIVTRLKPGFGVEEPKKIQVKHEHGCTLN